ncbi:MAG: FtsH protease activity modulator HflK [Rickettsiales bacterium]|nr:FtsH protease activity modulator HflK [Rickettsiales bacterium]
MRILHWGKKAHILPNTQGPHNNGPWGRPPSGGGNQGGGRPPGGGNNPPPGGGGPDFDELFRRGQETVRRFTDGGESGGKGLLLIGAIVVVLWLSSGIYFVKADELGVVTTFGEFTRTTTPGVNYHLPYPIESVMLPRVTAVNHEEIGFRSGTSTRAGRTADVPLSEESLMLTGDENILDIDFEVQWKISSAPDFLFNIRNPEQTVKAVAESAMREVIGKSRIANVLAEGKLKVAQDTQKLMQDVLNSYNAGIEVLTVNLLKADPPAEVLDAQRDVQTALADAETLRNQAEAYHNDIVPKARGEAQKLVLDAEAYKQEVTARAQGEASRFLAIYNEYKQAKDVTKKRMYLETMETVLQGMTKVIIDSKGSNGVVPYLPLQELKPKPAEVQP